MNFPDDLADRIKNGAVGVIPTDTIFGITASIHNPEALERIYAIKGRTYSKPFVILISDLEQLQLLHVSYTQNVEKQLREIWKKPVSVIMTCKNRDL